MNMQFFFFGSAAIFESEGDTQIAICQQVLSIHVSYFPSQCSKSMLFSLPLTVILATNVVVALWL